MQQPQLGMPGMPAEPKADIRTMVGGYFAFLRRGLRYWYWVPLIFPLVAGGAIYYAYSRPLIWRSQSKVIFAYSTQLMGDRDRPEGFELRDPLKSVFSSRTFHQRVVEQGNLYPYLHTMDERVATQMAATNWDIESPDTFTLTFDGESPEEAQRVLGLVIQAFIDTRQSGRAAAAAGDLQVVQRQAADVDRQLDAAEERYRRFVSLNRTSVGSLESRRAGITTPGTPTSPTGIRPTLPTIEEEPSRPNESYRVRRARSRVRELEARISALQAPPPPVAPPTQRAQEPEAVRALREQLDEQRATLRRLLATYTEEYPDVRAARRRVSELEAQIRSASRPAPSPGVSSVAGLSAAERSMQLRAAADDLNIARQQLASAIREDRALEAANPQVDAGTRVVIVIPRDAGALPAVPPPLPPSADDELVRGFIDSTALESAYDRLRAAIDTQRDAARRLLNRELELQATLQAESESQRERITVQDAPNLPAKHWWPNRPKIIGVGCGGGLLFGLAVSMLFGFIDTRIYDSGDLRRWGELAELPPIPDLADLMQSAPMGGGGAYRGPPRGPPR